MTIELDLKHPEMNVRIRRRMDSITLKRVERVLQDNADIFAWRPEDMVSTDPRIATH